MISSRLCLKNVLFKGVRVQNAVHLEGCKTPCILKYTPFHSGICCVSDDERAFLGMPELHCVCGGVVLQYVRPPPPVSVNDL